MMAFPGMIAEAAKKAGMKLPENPDDTNYDANEYPHWHIFCTLQLGCSMYPGEHWENAKVIASIPDDEVKTVTLDDLIKKGYHSKALYV